MEKMSVEMGLKIAISFFEAIFIGSAITMFICALAVAGSKMAGRPNNEWTNGEKTLDVLGFLSGVLISSSALFIIVIWIFIQILKGG